MAILTDTDLLFLEPAIFTDATVAALRLFSSEDAAITGTLLTSTTADFEQIDVSAGDVIVVSGEPLEIIARTDKQSLTVTSRREPDMAPISPGDGSGLKYELYTFRPLIDASEQWLNRALGLDANHPTLPLTSANVLNYGDFLSLIALRTVATAFALAGAADPADASLRDRTELYERLGMELRQHLVASVDVTGDGTVDEQRRLAVGTWVRI